MYLIQGEKVFKFTKPACIHAKIVSSVSSLIRHVIKISKYEDKNHGWIGYGWFG